MNVISKTKKVDWRRIAGIAFVVLLVGYNYAHPTLEQWFKTDLPSFSGTDDQPSSNASRSRDRAQSPSAQDDRYRATLPVEKNGTTQRSKPQQAKSQSTEFLKSVGRNNLQSPAGLLYTMGPRREHRVDHVMRHGDDMPSRPVHSVFEGDKNEILATIDEAYQLIKSNSPQVKKSQSKGNDEYTIRMYRKVGYEGGQKGKRKGYPSLKSIKLILDGNRVITAYPYR